MKLKSTIILFLFFVSTVACAQVDSKKGKVQESLYSFGGCSISVSLLKESSFRTEGKTGTYYVPLSVDPVPPVSYEDLTPIGLVCFTGEKSEAIEIMTGGFIYNKKWVKSSKPVARKSEDEAPIILLSFKNWDAIIRINPPVPPKEDEKPGPLEIHNEIDFCLKETCGSQLLCGVNFSLKEGDLELNRMIDAFKTITFVETDASKK